MRSGSSGLGRTRNLVAFVVKHGQHWPYITSQRQMHLQLAIDSNELTASGHITVTVTVFGTAKPHQGTLQLQLQYLARQSRATHKGARGSWGNYMGHYITVLLLVCAFPQQQAVVAAAGARSKKYGSGCTITSTDPPLGQNLCPRKAHMPMRRLLRPHRPCTVGHQPGLRQQ
jgi:hypothetical protein